MIDILGYITLYLIVGVVLLPLPILMDKLTESKMRKTAIPIYILIWPVLLLILPFSVWQMCWKELKNYK